MCPLGSLSFSNSSTFNFKLRYLISCILLSRVVFSATLRSCVFDSSCYVDLSSCLATSLLMAYFLFSLAIHGSTTILAALRATCYLRSLLLQSLLSTMANILALRWASVDTNSTSSSLVTLKSRGVGGRLGSVQNGLPSLVSWSSGYV